VEVFDALAAFDATLGFGAASGFNAETTFFHSDFHPLSRRADTAIRFPPLGGL
jgi:hypothetical protein